MKRIQIAWGLALKVGERVGGAGVCILALCIVIPLILGNWPITGCYSTPIQPTVPFEPAYRLAATEFVPWEWLAGQGWKESAGFQSRYVYGPDEGGAGERGVAQFMAATWDEWGRGEDPWDPNAAIAAQGRYMEWLAGYMQANGRKPTLPWATMGYLHGPTGALRYQTLEAFPERSRQYLKEIQDYRDLIKEKNDE